MTHIPPYILHEGPGRLLISVPHAGTHLPAPIAATLNDTGRSVSDTDWHVDKLYEFAAAEGATLLIATHSRSVVDLNRSPDGGKLYPGQAETGICPLETFDGLPLYQAAPPSPADIAARVDRYWRPYHTALAAQLARIKAIHGTARLLDGHSIRATIPRLFEGTLPDLNFGTNGGAAASPALTARVLAACDRSGFSQILDGRFRGGFITRHYGAPAKGIEAIQLELAQTTYLDEAAPNPFNPARAQRLIAVLRVIVTELLGA
jgi:N-formylglutamate deformylase